MATTRLGAVHVGPTAEPVVAETMGVTPASLVTGGIAVPEYAVQAVALLATRNWEPARAGKATMGTCAVHALASANLAHVAKEVNVLLNKNYICTFLTYFVLFIC